MTTGEPVVVRAAMKPLPTLTKPLRSVDIATHEPAEALRERTDSATIPAAGVVGEAMVAFVLAGAYREKFGGDHVDDVLEAVRAVRGAHRVAALKPALVFIGFMGAGKSRAAREAAAALGVAADDADALLEAELGRPIAGVFARDGEAAFRAAEEELAGALLETADGGVIALGGGALHSERVRAALDAPRRRPARRRPRHGVGARAPQRPPAGPRARRLRGALPRARAGLRRGRRRRAAGDRRRRRGARARRAARDPRGPAPAVGHERLGRLPGVGRAARARALARGRAPRGGQRRDRRRAARRARARRRRPRRGPAGRGAQDARDGRAGLARARRAGRHPRRPRRGARRRRGRRPRGLLRGHLPARRRRRAGADHARGPGRLRLRRQDRRRPARGQELRRRLSPADRGAHRSRRCWPRCPPPSWPPATPRWSRPR